MCKPENSVLKDSDHWKLLHYQNFPTKKFIVLCRKQLTFGNIHVKYNKLLKAMFTRKSAALCTVDIYQASPMDLRSGAEEKSNWICKTLVFMKTVGAIQRAALWISCRLHRWECGGCVTWFISTASGDPRWCRRYFSILTFFWTCILSSTLFVGAGSLASTICSLKTGFR